MGVNGVELKVGQVWMDRECRSVTIVRKNDDTCSNHGSPSKWPYIGSNNHSYTEKGTVWEANSEAGADLIELVQDENGWRPWKATADSVCPVAADTRVEARLATGYYERTKRADELMWRQCGDLSIIAYKVVEEAAQASTPDPVKQSGDDSNAIRILRAAECHMRDRAATYDTPEGERSMGKAVAAFNAIRDRDLTEAEGWLLIQLLKDVRLFSAPGYHADSAEDCIAYAALKAEAKAGEVASGA